MSDRALPRRRCLARALAVFAATLLAAGLASCGGGPRNPAAAAPALPTPLATSLQTAAGVWAAVPMGHVDQPLNTFWQLFFRPTGASTWSNQVEATAVATNGGLILAAGPSALLVGVRPSNLLTFSPLLASSNGGRSWSTGLLPSGLAARPDALAAGARGHALALVGARSGVNVLASTSGLSAWQLATTAHTLVTSVAGRSCGLESITAVAYLAADPLVGGSCSRPGVVGMFIAKDRGWRLLEGISAAVIGHARVEVLLLQSTSGGVRALLGLASQAGTSLIAAWQQNGHWHSSQPLAVAASQRLSSYGPAAGGGLFVLLAGASGAKRLAVTGAAGGGWQQLPPPPASTATVAFGPPTGAVSALAVQDTVLSVWRLVPAAHTWVRGQVINVPIEFGSSE